MRKFIKKLLSVSLASIILLNIIMPVVQAVPIKPDESSEIVVEDNVNKEGSYAIYGLEYEAYDKAEYDMDPKTAKTKKTYNVGDVVKISLNIKETNAQWEGLSQLQASIWYDVDVLEPISKNNEDYEDFKFQKNYSDWMGNELENGYISVNAPTVDKANLKAGDWVMEMFFIALTDSNTKTSVVVYDIQSDDKSSGDAYTWQGNANTPILELPEPQEQPELKTHGIEITKVDEEGNPITTSPAIYRITTPSGEKKLVQTNENIENGKLLLSGLTMPLTSGGNENGESYIIEELSAPHGYIIDQVPKTLIVKFDTDGTILEAKIGETVQTVTNNVIALSFTNEKEEEEPPVIPDSHVTFIINKIDENGNLITEDSASFGLKVTSEDVMYLTTNNGTVTKQVKIPEDISTPITYTLNEVKAPDGYVLDGQDINIDVTYTKNADNTVSVTLATKTSGTNATISNVGNIITINVKNEKIKEQEKFQIEITKVDGEGNAITEDSAMFLVTSPNGSSQMVQTNTTNGKVSLQGNIPDGDLDPNGYVYKIQEIKAPSGYKNNLDEISLNIKFSDETGTRRVSSVDIQRKNIESITRRNSCWKCSII